MGWRKPILIVLYSISSLLIGYGKYFAQSITEPSVKIKDHNNNTKVISIDCDYNFLPGNKIQLSADYPEIRQPSRYEVSSTPFEPVGNFTDGNIVRIRGNSNERDDVFGDIIQLPFDFCFYGNKYREIVISDNGIVSFNTDQKKSKCPLAPATAIPYGLPKNSIFGIFHDLVNLDHVRFYVVGKAPNRKAVINYNNIPQYEYAMPHKNTTSQIVLYETSNIIDVYIKDRYKNESTKDIFEGDGAFRKNATVGITNYDSSAGVAAPGRDGTNWEAHDEGWRFTPAGDTNITLIWKYNGKEIPDTRDEKIITVQPRGDATYSVEVTYNLCDPITVTDEIDVKFSQDFPTAKDITTEGFCVDNGESYTIDLTQYKANINPDPTLTLSYFENLDENSEPVDPITSPTNYTYSNDKTIYVKVLKNGVCYALGKINLRLNKKPVVPENQYFEECDPDNDGEQIIKIKDYNFTGLEGTDHKAFISQEDAEKGINEINEDAFILDVDDSGIKTLYLRVWNSSFTDFECYSIVPFQVKLKKTIQFKKLKDPFYICDVNAGQTIIYNLTQHEPGLIEFPKTKITFEYYTDSSYGSEYKISNPTAAEITLNTPIYVKAYADGYCENYFQIKLEAKNCKNKDNEPTGPGGPEGGGGPICDAKQDSYTVNLDRDYLRFYLPGGLSLDDIDIIGFYDSDEDFTISETAPYTYTFPVPFSIMITAKYKIKSSGITTSINFPINASKRMEIYPDTFDVCDMDGTGRRWVILDSELTKIIGSYYKNTTNILYFKSEEDLQAYNRDKTLENNITKVEVISPYTTTVYVRVSFYDCIYEHKIYFKMKPVQVENPISYAVCDFDTDGKEIINILKLSKNEGDLKALLKALLDPTQSLEEPIRYYLTKEQASNNAPNDYIKDEDLENFEVNASHMSIWARLEIENECPKIVEIKFYFTSTIDLPDYKTELTPCADNNNQLMNFNLNEFIVSKDPHSEISFYSNEEAALKNDIGFRIGGGIYDGTTPLLYDVTKTPLTIYIRVFDKKTNCVKALPVTITLVPFPEIQKSVINICDYNNDKQEETTTEFIQNQLISNNPGLSVPPTMEYKFFTTQEEANANLIPSLTSIIATPTNSIWVRVLKNIGDCPAVFELKFNLIEPPTLNSEELDYTLCNNNTGNENGAVSEKVNLNDYKDDILGFPYTNDYQFNYYDTEDEAHEVPNEYTITSFPKTIWVRVTYTPTGCFSLKTLTFNQAPSLDKDIKDTEIIACSTGEMSKIVNLEDYPPQMVIAPANLNDFEISYHTSRKDAVNNVPITSDITKYTITPISSIWIKFKDKRKEGYGCYIIKKLNITLYDTPKTQDIFPELCDESDGKLDGNFVISDLDIYKTNIITGEDLEVINALYPFTYYSTLQGAEDKNPDFLLNKNNFTFSEADITQGTGSDPNFYIIYARVDKNDHTGCYSIVAISFQINKKVPLAKDQEIIEQCDENDVLSPEYNDGKSTFNLTLLEDQWINVSTLHPGSKTSFSYFTNKTDATLNQNPIANPAAYVNSTPYNETIYVRISADRQCDNIASIKLIVYPSIVAEDYNIGEICEFEDGTGNEIHIDLTAPISSMQKNIDPSMITDLQVTFYTSLSDAQRGVSGGAVPLGDLDAPTTAITEYLPVLGRSTIYVRFESKSKGCFTVKEINMHKLKAPKTKSVSYLICDEDLDDIYYIIPKELDTSGFITNPENYNFTYYLSKEDAWTQTSELPSDQRYVITSFTTDIYVRVMDKRTGCINVETVTITTNPKITLKNNKAELIACDVDNDGYTYFNLALVISDIIDPLVQRNSKISYYSSLEDARKQQYEITDFNVYQNIQANTDYVYVRFDDINTIGKKCPSLARIKLNTYSPINPLPKDIYLCPRIDSQKLDGGDFDEWEWSFNGKVISTKRYYTVKDTGIYTLKVTKYLNYELTCSVIFTVEVKPLEDPVIVELKTGDNYITVIAKGPQPLEYSMDNINWQKTNTFNNLNAGIYTFYVRSTTNGCEAVTSKGIIFKVPNVITPNGDGYNDTWKLCGLNLFSSPSHIKIFDRYGKMVFEQQSNNCFLWDGKYLGRNLPTTSYWYIITIADNRKYTGWILLRNYNENFR